MGFDADGHTEVGHDGFDHVDLDGSHDVPADADMDGSHDAGMADHGDGTADHQHHHLGGVIAFTLVSIRSVIAFATLFTWAGTLYLISGTSVVLTVVYSLAWGLVAMFAVSYLVHKLVQLQETGNISLWNCIGEEALVYMDIPADGAGKVRVVVSGVLSYVDARTRGEEPLFAGTKVRVSRILDANTIEVVPMENQKED